jgi:hypothetical protein
MGLQEAGSWERQLDRSQGAEGTAMGKRDVRENKAGAATMLQRCSVEEKSSKAAQAGTCSVVDKFARRLRRLDHEPTSGRREGVGPRR